GFLVYPVVQGLGSTTDRAERRQRLGRWTLLLGCYGAVRIVLGYGTHGSGMYLDPTSQPGAFLRRGLVRLPVLIGDVVFGVRADWWNTGFPWAARFAHLSDAFGRDIRPFRNLQLIVGLVAALVLWLVAARSVRTSRSGEPSPRFVAIALPFSF